MGVYYRKFLESDIENSFQSPENIGNDLDQIENDIAGPDGIECSREEIEDATEGMIGDPVDECYYSIFESETNYNMLMQKIGITELQEACNGRELVLEASDEAGFFNKVKKIILSMFARITEFFKSVISKIKTFIRNDKEYYEKNSKVITKGFNSKKWNSVKGYEFPQAAFKKYKEKLGSKATSIAGFEPNYEEIVRDLTQGVDLNLDKTDCIFRATGLNNISDIKEMTNKVYTELKGSDQPVTIEPSNLYNWSIDKVKSILTSDESKIVSDCYNDVKNYYKGTLKKLEDLKTKVENDTSYSSTQKSNKFIYLNKTIKRTQFYLTIADSVNKIMQKIVIGRRALARKLVKSWIKAGKGASETTTSISDSASFGFTNNIFRNMEIV